MQGLHVARPQDGEMPVIECREPAFAHPLDNGQDGRVYEAEREIFVTAEQLINPRIVNPQKIGDLKSTAIDVAQEGAERAWREAARREPVHLDYHGSRDDEHLIGFGQETGTGSVIGVVRIEGREDRARVADQRHVRGSNLISPACRAAWFGPFPDAPAPTKASLGRG